MIYVGFIERKEFEKQEAKLNQLLMEKEQIEMDIEQAKKELELAEYALKNVTNPTIEPAKELNNK